MALVAGVNGMHVMWGVRRGAFYNHRLSMFPPCLQDDDDEAYRPSPFRWAHVGHRGHSAARPGDDDDDGDEEGQAYEEGQGSRRGGRDDGEEDSRWRQGERSPEELLENLARFMWVEA